MQLVLPEEVNLETIPDITVYIDQLFREEFDHELTIDLSGVRNLNMSGVGMLLNLKERCEKQKIAIQFKNAQKWMEDLLRFVNLDEMIKKKTSRPLVRGFLERLGRTAVWYVKDFFKILEFLGRTCSELFRELVLPHKIHWKDTLYYVEMTGVNAIPIIGLISFLLGMIIAFQASGQLAIFGANVFVVELVSLSMTRELAPLITAIIVAGRSGSAFTAEIGTMKVAEEIDAMRVMGLDLTEYLIAPKVWALIISLPLLAFWADITSLLGGAVIANVRLDIEYFHFLSRLQETLALRHVLMGIGKCYIFAVVISLVGCYRGLNVTSGASSVGRQTTSSVVTSIFFVIIADAVFSIFFTLLRI